MGMYNIECPKCSRHHMWFSGNTDQRCVDCVDYTKGPDNTVTYEIPGDPRITLPAAPSVCDHLWTVLPTYPPKPGPCAKCAAAAPDFAIREEPKPASAPREWWLVKETEESIHHYVLYSPPLEMLPQPFEVVPVIEKSVYKRLKRVLDDTVKTSHEAVEMFKQERDEALVKSAEHLREATTAKLDKIEAIKRRDIMWKEKEVAINARDERDAEVMRLERELQDYRDHNKHLIERQKILERELAESRVSTACERQYSLQYQKAGQAKANELSEAIERLERELAEAKAVVQIKDMARGGFARQVEKLQAENAELRAEMNGIQWANMDELSQKLNLKMKDDLGLARAEVEKWKAKAEHNYKSYEEHHAAMVFNWDMAERYKAALELIADKRPECDCMDAPGIARQALEGK